MCIYLDAVVTETAVGAARRPVEFARLAPFHSHLNLVDLRHLVQRLPKVVLFVRMLCRRGGEGQGNSMGVCNAATQHCDLHNVGNQQRWRE